MPISVLSSAFVAALVGFGGTVALVVQAMQAMGGSAQQVGSAVTALCLAIALAGGGLSLALRMPVVLAWSTPGAALVAAAGAGAAGFPSAVGAFVVAALLGMALGLVPALGRLAARIPASIAAAMLAGVLLPFCMALFRGVATDAALACLLLAVFVAARPRWPTYALPLALAAGIALVLARGPSPALQAAAAPGAALFGGLRFTAPVFEWRTALGLGVPLFLVTLVSQNLPGFVVLRSAGYRPPPGPVLLATGAASLAAAPFGAHAVNLAAITAAICTSPDAHPDAARRWRVGMAYAGFYLLLAAFSAPLVRSFAAMPPATVAAIAGLALLAPLAGALGSMLEAPRDREAAVITFAATASGLSLAGIGPTFWGLAAGFLALGLRRLAAPRAGA
ncbi:MAG: benzoate/H(+) symporter BenE family transporter [Xylophilus ampelinus]